MLKNNRQFRWAIGGLFLLAALATTELLLQVAFGLGHPLLYDANPLYGFRPKPNQHLHRFGGAKITINNLGLRTTTDWDNSIERKIVFLGDSVTYGGSYTSDTQLFTFLATQSLPGYQCGNAAVNAWGVENIHGLIVESHFLPAQFYLTTVIEADFYRGLTRIQGQPFWCRKPAWAIEELLFFWICNLNNRRYLDWERFADERTKRAVVEKAVLKMKDMDAFLKAQQLNHQLYILPMRGQIVNNESRDNRLYTLLSKLYPAPVIYLKEQIDRLGLSHDEKAALYVDDAHLSDSGHQLYGKLLAASIKQMCALPPVH